MNRIVSFPAIHPHWVGTLTLNLEDSRVKLDPFGSTGRYEFKDNEMVLFWDKFPSEKFIFAGNICVHEKLIESITELSHLKVAKIDGCPVELKEISFCVIIRNLKYTCGLEDLMR